MTSPNTRKGIVCAGNWIIDIVHFIDHWPEKSDLTRIRKETVGVGGGAANVMTDLHAFGVDFDLYPVGRIGCDQHSEFILDHCRQINVPTRYFKRDQNSATAHTHVMNVAGDSRTFFHHGGSNDTFCRDDIDFNEIEKTGSKIFYLGYLMLLGTLDKIDSNNRTQAAEILETANEMGMITCVDLVSADREDFSRVIAVAAYSIDYLIINEVEAERATGMSITDVSGKIIEERLQNACQHLFELGIKKAVVVHAPQIAYWVSRNGSFVKQRSEKISEDDVKSPVGAGDAFCAGILFGIHEDWPVENSLRLAHRAACAVLKSNTATGGIPPLSNLMSED